MSGQAAGSSLLRDLGIDPTAVIEATIVLRRHEVATVHTTSMLLDEDGCPVIGDGPSLRTTENRYELTLIEDDKPDTDTNHGVVE